MLRRLAFVALLIASLSACKQGKGEYCQINDDCESGLVCAPLTDTCEESATTPGIDAGPDAENDASVAPTVAATATPTTLAAGDPTTLTITVTNFTLEAPTEPPAANAPGVGHYHVYLDADTTPLVMDATPTVAVTIPNGTAAGAHMLHVELVNNDHTSLVPVVQDVVDITVQ